MSARLRARARERETESVQRVKTRREGTRRQDVCRPHTVLTFETQATAADTPGRRRLPACKGLCCRDG
jgi:hypothetical protein